MKPARRRAVVEDVQTCYEVSERRACETLACPRSSHRYQSIRDDRLRSEIRLRDLASSRPGYGYRRLHILLKREGWQVNAKLVYRLWFIVSTAKRA